MEKNSKSLFFKLNFFFKIFLASKICLMFSILVTFIVFDILNRKIIKTNFSLRTQKFLEWFKFELLQTHFSNLKFTLNLIFILDIPFIFHLKLTYNNEMHIII